MQAVVWMTHSGPLNQLILSLRDPTLRTAIVAVVADPMIPFDSIRFERASFHAGLVRRDNGPVQYVRIGKAH